MSGAKIAFILLVITMLTASASGGKIAGEKIIQNTMYRKLSFRYTTWIIIHDLFVFLHIIPVPQDSCCQEKGVPRICLGICMGSCIETPDEPALPDNLCTEYEPIARECCEKEKGK